MGKQNYKFYIEYEGTRYSGWQRLKDEKKEKTIQGKIENVLDKLYDFPQNYTEITASGRTDAGVHAKEQIMNILLPNTKTMEEILKYCNNYLPEDIKIKKIEKVEEKFHSRYNAVKKEYHYKFSLEKPSPFIKNFVCYCPNIKNIEAMKKASKKFLGEHNFISFSSLKKSKLEKRKKSTIRNIEKIDIVYDEIENIYIFKFIGNGFLKHMIRILMGTLIEIGENKREAESIVEIFREEKRENAGFLAQAKGLTLYKVEYKK